MWKSMNNENAARSTQSSVAEKIQHSKYKENSKSYILIKES